MCLQHVIHTERGLVVQFSITRSVAGVAGVAGVADVADVADGKDARGRSFLLDGRIGIDDIVDDERFPTLSDPKE